MGNGAGAGVIKDEFQDQLGKLVEEIQKLREEKAKLQMELELRHRQVADAFDDLFNRPEKSASPPERERRY